MTVTSVTGVAGTPVPPASTIPVPARGPGADFPLPVPSRTPQLLRRLQAAVAVGLLLAGAVATWLILDLRNDLASAPNLTQQYGRLGEVQHSLNRALYLATQAAVAGEKVDGDHATQATEKLASAGALLVEAARDRPQDAAALGELSQGVLRFALDVSAGAGQPRAEAIASLATAEADLDALATQVGALQAQLSAEASARRWSQDSPAAWLTALVVLAGLVAVSWVVAQRSRRVLNLGLVAAGVALVFVIGTAASAQATAAEASDASRGEQFGRVVAATTATSELDEARRALAHAVLHRTWNDTAAAKVTKAMTAADSAVTVDTMPSLDNFEAARNRLAKEMLAGSWAAAGTHLLDDGDKSLDTTAYGFQDAAATIVGEATQTAATSPDVARNGLLFQLVVVVLLALAGAALGVLGLERRVREYR